MDPIGGGTLIKRELISPRQVINGVDTDVTPIGDQVDGPHLAARGEFVLHPFRRGDPGVEALWPELLGDDNPNDALYSVRKDAIDHGLWAWPAPVEEWPTKQKEVLKLWPDERLWVLKTLDAATVQFNNIVVAIVPAMTAEAVLERFPARRALALPLPRRQGDTPPKPLHARRIPPPSAEWSCSSCCRIPFKGLFAL